jgi:hypothetical protein
MSVSFRVASASRLDAEIAHLALHQATMLPCMRARVSGSMILPCRQRAALAA